MLAPALLRWNDLSEMAWLARWWLCSPTGPQPQGVLQIGQGEAELDGALGLKGHDDNTFEEGELDVREGY